MIAAPVLWLPPPQEGEIERAAAAFLARWAADWLASPRAVIAAVQPAGAAETCEWTSSGGCAVATTLEERVGLGWAIAGGEGEPEHPADRAVFVRIADSALADLAARLGECSPTNAASAGRRDEDHAMVRLSQGDEVWSLLLSLDREAQVALRKLAAGRNAQPTLASLREVVASQAVRVGCHLGGAIISARDLAGLAAGDLITFDRRLADELPLTVGGAATSYGKAKVVPDGAGAAVKITAGVVHQQP